MASTCTHFSEHVCVICRVAFCDSADSDIATVGTGRARLLEYSEKNSDAELTEYLHTNPSIVKVHNRCRLNYTNKRRFDQMCSKDSVDNDLAPPPKSLRSIVYQHLIGKYTVFLWSNMGC